MRLSIISVNLNNRLGLQKTIDSVISQTFKDFEYIIIDGDSIDGSKELIETYSKYISYYISEKDTGIYNAMNKGIKKAQGEYIMFLNSGDSFCDITVLEKCSQFLNSNFDKDIYYGDIFVVENINSDKKKLRKYPETLSLAFFKADTINHQASLIRASLFKKYQLYPENYKLASDFWFYVKCMLNKVEFKYLDFPLVNYDFTGLSSLNYEKYIEEKQIVWEQLIPQYFLEIEKESEIYKTRFIEYRNKFIVLNNYRIIKVALKLNKFYQRIKKNIKK